MKYPIPNNLTVLEVSLLTGLTKQEVRRKCKSGEFIGHQKSGENGIWLIETSQFLNIHPNWDEFTKKRDEMFDRSKKAAELAIQLWDETEDASQDERMSAERFIREKASNDEAAIIAEQEGRKQRSIEEAVEDAIKQRNIEIALEMIDAGLNDDIITRTTQLTKEDIQSLREAKK